MIICNIVCERWASKSTCVSAGRSGADQERVLFGRPALGGRTRQTLWRRGWLKYSKVQRDGLQNRDLHGVVPASGFLARIPPQAVQLCPQSHMTYEAYQT